MSKHRPYGFESLRYWRASLLMIVVSLFALGASACGESESTSPPLTKQKGDSTATAQADGASFKVKPGVVTGYVDSIQSEGESVDITGWAASSDFKLAAETVAGKVNGKTVAEAVPVLERADVASIYGKPGLKQSGFALRVPLSALSCSAPSGGLTVFGLMDGVGSELEFVENTDADLSAAC